MKQLDIKKNKWIWYFLYSVILVIFFLYVLFPSREIEKLIISSAQSIRPGIIVNVGKISPTLSPGIKIREMRIFERDNPQITVFQTGQTTIKPKLFSLLRGRKAFKFSSRLYDGRLSGTVTSQKSSGENNTAVVINIRDVYIYEGSGLPSSLSDRLEGIINGTVSFTGNPNRPFDGSGNAEIYISEGIFRFLNPVLGLEEMEFGECSIKAELNERRVNLVRGILKGKDMNANAEGSITIREKIPESILNLRGEIEIYPSFFQRSQETSEIFNILRGGLKDSKLPFTITGAIDSPGISFIR